MINKLDRFFVSNFPKEKMSASFEKWTFFVLKKCDHFCFQIIEWNESMQFNQLKDFLLFILFFFSHSFFFNLFLLQETSLRIFHLDKTRGPSSVNDDEDMKQMFSNNHGNTIRLLLIDNNSGSNSALDQVKFLFFRFFFELIFAYYHLILIGNFKFKRKIEFQWNIFFFFTLFFEFSNSFDCVN